MTRLRRRRPETARADEETVVPDRQGLPEIPQAVGHDARPTCSSASASRRSPQQAHEKDPEQRGARHRRADPELLQQKQSAVRASRAPRRPAHPDENARRRRTPPRAPSRAARAGLRPRRSTRPTPPRRRPAACCSGVSKGQQDRAFDQAAFSAKKGVIVGPVKGQFGFYIVRVTSDHAARSRRRSPRRERRSERCSSSRASREDERRSSETSRSAGRTRRTAARATSSRSARTRRSRRTTSTAAGTPPATGGASTTGHVQVGSRA